MTVTVDGCWGGGGGIIWLWFASAGTEKERPLWDCEGQTGLISLQRPLKFLPCDINEVIHRKAAARHTTPPPLLPPQSSSHFNNLLQPPSPPRVSTKEGERCAREEAHTSPREHDSSRSMAPERGAGEQRGGMCSCACVAMPGEGDNSLALCPTSTEKYCSHSSEHKGLRNGCVVFVFFPYFCVPVVCLSLAVMSNCWGKAY